MSENAEFWGRFGLGTRLRLLQERLNKDVDQFYQSHDVEFKTRFYAVFKLLKTTESKTIKTLSEEAGTSHSAMSQTIKSMVDVNYVKLITGDDARQKVVLLTEVGESMLKQLNPLWEQIDAANETMMASLNVDFYAALSQLEAALDETSLLQRIQNTATKGER